MKTKREHNIYALLALKTLLALFVLLLSQTLFFAINSLLFSPVDSNEWIGIALGNIVFGMATVSTFLLPYYILMLLPLKVRWHRGYRIAAETLYIVALLAMVIPRICNTAYYPFTLRLLSDEIFSYLGISGQMGTLLPMFLRDYWLVWLSSLLILLLFFFINSRLHLAERNNPPKHLGNDLLGTVLGALLVWFFMRGGFGPFIQPSDAAAYARPINSTLVNNDSYNILRTLCLPDLDEGSINPDGGFDALHTPAAIADTTAVPDNSAPRPNIVLLVVESLGQEYMGCYNADPQADTRTPFLDSLARHSTLYDGRANGKKSIEGITALNTGLPNLMHTPFTNSVYDTNCYTGLPNLLRHYGYHTAFYHGSYNGVMDFDRVCPRMGFDEYQGMDEYLASGFGSESDYDGAWGIFDEPFLLYTLEHINRQQSSADPLPTPFFAEIFTVTSHHPYPLPEQYQRRITKGRHPILKCVEYTDQALRHFFTEASKQPWFTNTLFIIVGDHSGPILSKTYTGYDGYYRIPFMVYNPQQPEGHRSPRIVQQTDLYPTLADYLGLPDKFVCFGQSLLQQEQGWQVYFGNGYHCLVRNNATVPEMHDIAVLEGAYEQGSPDDLKLLKAIISQYNHRILNNKLCEQ